MVLLYFTFCIKEEIIILRGKNKIKALVYSNGSSFLVSSFSLKHQNYPYLPNQSCQCIWMSCKFYHGGVNLIFYSLIPVMLYPSILKINIICFP